MPRQLRGGSLGDLGRTGPRRRFAPRLAHGFNNGVPPVGYVAQIPRKGDLQMTDERLRIVIINDDANDMSLLRQSLSNESGEKYELIEASTGEEGLDACLGPGKPRPDCVIVDLHLPDMSGLDVLSRLKDEAGKVQAAVLLFIDTGEECKVARAALRAGAEEYIAKSWLTPDGLTCAIENAIERFKLRERLRWKRAELDRQDREFRALVENVPDIITRFDRQFRHLYINPAIERASGLRPEAFLGKTSREAGMPRELCDYWEWVLKEAIDSGRESTFDFDFETPQGTRHFQARLVPQFSATGEVESVLAVSTDVTERKWAEEAYREGEEHLRNVIDRLIAFVGVMTPTGILVEANRPALEAASLKPQDVLGKPFEETFWWSYSPSVQAELRRAIECAARGDRVRYDVVIRTGEDRFMTIDFMIAPLVDAHGKVTHLIPSAFDITSRKRTEEAMRKIAARERVRTAELQAVLRATPAAIWIATDRECRHISGNPASYELVGMPEPSNTSASAKPEELAQRTFLEFRDGLPVEPHDLPMQRAASQGVESQGTELTLRFRDGSERHLYGNATPLREPDGAIYGAISAFIDITKLKQAEEAVRLSEERFRLASEAVNGVIYEWDPGTGRVERSGGLLALTGFRPEQAEPTLDWWLARLHPDDRERATATPFASMDDPEALRETEYRVRHRDGSYRHVWDRARVVHDDQGRIARVVGYTIDITERVKGEEVLRLSEKRFKRLATSDIIGIVFGSVHGNLNYVNDEYLRIIGYSREQFEGARILWPEITPPEWFPADKKGIAEARRTGSCTPYEKEYVRQDGSRIPVLIGYTLLDEAGDDLVAFILDLTERKRSEQALKDADRRKDDFLAMLAHELRNPLAAICTAVQILRLKGPPEPELTWGREVIERQAKHLTRLIDDLLDVSRISTGKIQLQQVSVDVCEIAMRAVESIRPLMTAKQHDLRIELPPGPLRTLADPVRLEQVVCNILTNAAKYTDDQGTITFTAGKEGSSVVLRIRDNGIGIAPEMVPHVFDLYAQVDGSRTRSQGGLGIGLTLVKMLVELHGGSVSAASAGPGKGSEFTIRLPALESSSLPLAGTAPGGPVYLGPQRKSARVLLVDDNVDMALGLAVLIEASGYEVETAHEGHSALESARAFQPKCVLMDIGLPGLNGYELAQAFRQEPDLQHATLVAISGYSQTCDRERAHAAGFDHLLIKPVDLETLLPILAERVSRGGSDQVDAVSPTPRRHQDC